MPGEVVGSFRSKPKMARPSGRLSKCPLLTKNCWESMENQLSSSGIFSRNLHHCRFFRGSRMICRNGTLNLKILESELSSCQCSTTSNGQEKETQRMVCQILKKSRRTRRDSRMDIGRSSVLETKRSGMELATPNLRENGIPSLHRWCNDSRKTSHPVFTSVSALTRGILRKFQGTESIHFSADVSNTELSFRISHSVNQRSIFGAVSNWCEEFGPRPNERTNLGKARSKRQLRE